MTRPAYATGLTDTQWAILEPLIPPAHPHGRRRSVDQREVWNALWYVTRTGGHWRLLPHDVPKWPTVYHDHRRFLDDGTWEAINDALRQQVRLHAGRHAEPSAAIIDSQSVQTAEKGGPVAMTAARRERAGSGIFSLTRWGC